MEQDPTEEALYAEMDRVRQERRVTQAEIPSAKARRDDFKRKLFIVVGAVVLAFAIYFSAYPR